MDFHIEPRLTCLHALMLLAGLAMVYAQQNGGHGEHDCHGHGSYDHDTDTCLCFEEWMGTHCETHRSLYCNHGTYHKGDKRETTGHCKCDKGWHGDRCETPICGDHGDYVNDRKRDAVCHCHQGWSGHNCDHEICGHGGTYVHTSGSHYHCVCIYPWTGSHCRDQESTTTPDPASLCSFHGLHFDGYCICDPNWTGPTCAEVASTPTTTTTTTTTTTKPTTTAFINTHQCQHQLLSTQLLNKVSSSHPGAFVCPGSTSHTSHEALVLSNCLTVNNETTSWRIGKQVMPGCNNLPLFTAVAAFDNNQYVSQGGLSGILMECTTNGFKIAVQECGLDPAIVTITTQGVNLMDALNYYTIL